MVSLTLITVGFLVATGLVVALARESTARWERAKRAPVAVRAAVPARQTSPAGSALRTAGAMARRGVAALRGQASRLPPVTALGRLLPKGLKRGTPGRGPSRRLLGELRPSRIGGNLRRGRWTKGRSPALPVDGDEAPRDATDARSGGVAGAAGQERSRRTVPRAHRRALAFLHRHEGPQDARTPHESSDGSPTARS
jgi:hypothetical protein